MHFKGRGSVDRCIHWAKNWCASRATFGAHLWGETAQSQSTHPKSSLSGKQQQCHYLP